MSSSLSNRLEKLENEIQILLLLNKHDEDPPAKVITNTASEVRARSSSVPAQKAGTTRTYSCSPNRVQNKSANLPKRKVKKCSSVENSTLSSSSAIEVIKPANPKFNKHQRGDATEMTLRQKLETTETERDKLANEVQYLNQLVEELNNSKDIILKANEKLKKKPRLCTNKQMTDLASENALLHKTMLADREKYKTMFVEVQQYKKQLSSVKAVLDKNDDLMNCLKQKDQIIEALEKRAKDGDKKNSELRGQWIEASEELKRNFENYAQLKVTNDELAKSMTQQQHQLQAENGTIESYKQEIKRLMEICEVHDKRATNEIKLNQKLRSEIDTLQNKLKGVKKRETSTEHSIDVLQKELENLERQYEVLKDSTSNSVNQLKAERTALEAKYQKIISSKDSHISDYNTKLKQQSHELAYVKQTSKEKEDQLVGEREELKRLMEELTTIIKTQKEKMNELLSMYNEQQKIIQIQNKTLVEKEKIIDENKKLIQNKDCVIDNLQKSILSKESLLENQQKRLLKKDEEVRDVTDIADSIKKRYAALEKHVMNLKKSLSSEIPESNISKGAMMNEISALNRVIEDHRDALKVKEHMLDDHLNTISHLKKKLSEKEDQVAKLYRDIQAEKCLKNEANTKLLNSQRDIAQVRKDIETQNKIISNLESRLELEHYERQLEHNVFSKEKYQAMNAAKFATHKLAETMDDFKRNAESQNKVRDVLTNMLHEKDDKLKKAIVQMSALTLDPKSIPVKQNVKMVKSGYTTDSESFVSAISSSITEETDTHTMPKPFDERKKATSCQCGSDSTEDEDKYHQTQYANSYRPLKRYTAYTGAAESRHLGDNRQMSKSVRRTPRYVYNKENT